ncbi:uncharacterized protein [Fopius arisanus]|uniref:Uncharacterized protein n=1 Tax=Fopius arisanus TaxID=64838 RepID=A0A9R1U6V4_9HYME|nr:PREDICTED: uncharacterized protein LOC105270289 [Fopius arisanus]
MRRWLRNFVRIKTNPMESKYAAQMKLKLSTLYGFAVYNAFGIFMVLLVYNYYPMTAKEKKQQGRYYARLWQGDDITVYRVDGFKVIEKYEIEGTPKLIPHPSELLDDDSTGASAT